MKPSQIHKSLQVLIKTQQPVFLWGPPGVGKSQVIHQTAESLGLDIIDVRAILLDPVDLRGLPKITDNGLSSWCTPDFLPTSGKGILFLDELNAAPPLVQAACYQLVLDRKLGDYTLPEGWTVIAAGNRETDRAVTHRMPSALANRFVHIDFEVDSKEWISWAEKAGIHEEIIEFIAFRPALLHDFDPQADTRTFPSPRSWSFVSKFIQQEIDEDIVRELLIGTIGKAATTEFLAFVKVFRAMPRGEEILANPQTAAIPEDPSLVYAICEMLGSMADSENIDNVIAYANRLPEEFSVLLVREAVRHKQSLTQSKAFAQWAQMHSKVLV